MCIRDSNNNDKIVEVVALENKILNSDDNYEFIVGVESGEVTDQVNENKDDQVTYNTVSYTHLDVYKRQNKRRMITKIKNN